MNLKVFILLLCFTASCQKPLSTNSTPSPPPYNLWKRQDVKLFVEEHSINEEGQIIAKAKHIELTDSTLSYPSYIFETFSLSNYYHKEDDIGSSTVEIINGFPIGKYRITYGEHILKSILYKNASYNGFLDVFDTTGNLLYHGKFKEGSGYWKDFYYREGVLKEEGQVKHNYKDGKWIYYSKLGEIDSISVYTLQDSVDVRYPYCLFNKTEPCY